jgi:DNA-binding XRE family transcriptional regulator
MMSKAELARKAGLSTLTIDRVEAGRPCRLDTKRKILLALGLKVSDKDRIFGASEDAQAEGENVVRLHPGDRIAGDGSRGVAAATVPDTGSNAGPSNDPRTRNGEGIR